jgi:Ca-activated chloride channel homolog
MMLPSGYYERFGVPVRIVDMRRRDFVSFLGVGAVAQEPAAIRVDVNLVNVPFSVRDERGQLVKSLRRDDIDVLEDGLPQTVKHFSQGQDSALALGLLVDGSGSQEEFLKKHRRDLRDFLKNVMQAQDRAFLLGFGNHLRLVSGMTDRAEQVMDRLQQYQKGKEVDRFEIVGPRERRVLGTAFYDAIYYAAEDVLATAEGARRALVIFSDGEDNSSAHHMLDAIEAAQRAGVAVFGVRYTELSKGRWTARNKYGRAVMERIAKETGGLDLDATEAEDLREPFRQIADILRATYDLGYSSTNTGKGGVFRKIEIRGKQPGLKFRHKTGYFARSD